MRLDHLLSKEHVPVRLYTAEHTGQVSTETNVSAGAHGWNIDIDTDRIDPVQVRPGLPGKERTGLGWTVCCTLLGPEGPERNMKVFRTVPLDLLLFDRGLRVVGWGGYRPYFENYTVDASIF